MRTDISLANGKRASAQYALQAVSRFGEFFFECLRHEISSTDQAATYVATARRRDGTDAAPPPVSHCALRTFTEDKFVQAIIIEVPDAGFLLITGLGFGDLALGFISDLLRETHGEESLRYSILAGLSFYVIASILVFLAMRTIVRDWED